MSSGSYGSGRSVTSASVRKMLRTRMAGQPQGTIGEAPHAHTTECSASPIARFNSVRVRSAGGNENSNSAAFCSIMAML